MKNCHYLLLSLIIIFTCSPFTVPIKKIDLAVRDRRTTILKLLWVRIVVSFSLLLTSSLLILLIQGPQQLWEYVWLIGQLGNDYIDILVGPPPLTIQATSRDTDWKIVFFLSIFLSLFLFSFFSFYLSIYFWHELRWCLTLLKGKDFGP